MNQKNLPMHIAARKYAEILLKVDCCLYSQHISGIHNNVADALSCKTNLSDDDLTSFICSNYPSQVPNSVKIYPFPPELSSWVNYWLQKCKEKMELQKKRDKELRVWRRWLEYAKLIKFEHDIWLEYISLEG